MTDRWDDEARRVLDELSGDDHYAGRLRIIAATLRRAYEAGRATGRADVAKYSNAVGQIEAAIGYAGARPLRETVQAVRAMAARLAPAQPATPATPATLPAPVAPEMECPWPADAVGCDEGCGFTRAGIGWQCREGTACGRYLHPGDAGFAEVDAYYRAAHATPAPVTYRAGTVPAKENE
jgi:hypothetical protein